MLGERTRILNHRDKLKKGSKNRTKFQKDGNKVLHFIRNNQQLIFRMGNSRLSGTSMAELGSHKLKSIYNILSLPKKCNYTGIYKKKVQELRLPSAKGLSCSTAFGLVTAILGTSRDTNSSRNNQRFKLHQGGTIKAPGKLLSNRDDTGMDCLWKTGGYLSLSV